MEENKIRQLLDKFFEGRTSLEEEDTLAAYFSQPHLPAELERYRQFFAVISSGNVEEALNNASAPLDNSRHPSINPRRLSTPRVLAAIAAVALLLLILRPTLFNISPSPAELSQAKPKHIVSAAHSEEEEVLRRSGVYVTEELVFCFNSQ